MLKKWMDASERMNGRERERNRATKTEPTGLTGPDASKPEKEVCKKKRPQKNLLQGYSLRIQQAFFDFCLPVIRLGAAGVSGLDARRGILGRGTIMHVFNHFRTPYLYR